MHIDEVQAEIQLRFQRFQRAILSADYPGAAAEFQRLAKWLPEAGGGGVPAEHFHWLYLAWLDVMWRCGMEHRMIEVMDQFLELCPDDDETRVWRATILFHVCRFDEARTELEQFREQDFDDPRIYYYLAGLAERDGADFAAAELYREAFELDREFIPPTELTERDARELFARSLENLPEELRAAIQLMELQIEDLPAEQTLFSAQPPLDPWMLGCFWGPEYHEPDYGANERAPTIQLFLKNIARKAVRPREAIREFRSTLVLDVAQYLGIPENEIKFSPDADDDSADNPN